MTALIGEILQAIGNAKTRADRKKILKAYDHPSLRKFLKIAYDKNISFRIGKIPEFKPDDGAIGTSYANLFSEVKKLERLLDHPNNPLKQERCEILLMLSLEALNIIEAEYVINAIKYNDLKINGLTRKLIEECYPGLL